MVQLSISERAGLVAMLQLLALEGAETAVLLMAPLAEQVTESLKGLTDPM